MRSGFESISLENCLSSSGIVAENRRDWRFLGMVFIMRFTSGKNPMSKSRSHSSRTRNSV